MRGSNLRRSGRPPENRGWATYCRGVASSRSFASLDHYLWKLSYKWAAHATRTSRSPGSSAGTTAGSPRQPGTMGVRQPRQRGLPGEIRLDDDPPACLVIGAASPDDPALTGYWAQRRRRNPPPPDRSVLILLARQKGRCPLCGDLLYADQPPSPTEWERWHRVTRKAITSQYVTHHGRRAPGRHPPGTLALPARGNRRHERTSTPLHPSAPRACLSRMPRRVARTDLRGPRSLPRVPANPRARGRN